MVIVHVVQLPFLFLVDVNENMNYFDWKLVIAKVVCYSKYRSW